MKQKKRIEAADESFEMTFIALMLLLLCFMVVMVSLAQLEGPRFRKAIGSVRGALSMLSQAPGLSMVEDGGPGVLPQRGGTGVNRDEVDPETLARNFQALIQQHLGEDMENMVQVETSESGLALTLGSLVLFARGGASLRLESQPVLEEVAGFLDGLGGRIDVIGHTCDLPVHNARFPSNWDLSIARAVEVVRYLESAGIEGDRLIAVGMGESRPIVENTNEEQRALNRRVEILLTYDTVHPEVGEAAESRAQVEPLVPSAAARVQPSENATSVHVVEGG